LERPELNRALRLLRQVQLPASAVEIHRVP
jgi:hypothetical protein